MCIRLKSESCGSQRPGVLVLFYYRPILAMKLLHSAYHHNFRVPVQIFLKKQNPDQVPLLCISTFLAFNNSWQLGIDLENSTADKIA